MNRICSATIFFLILVSIACITNNKLKAQNPKFKHLTVDEGLAHNLVYNFIQDQDDFMWITTPEGLNRYDGYKIKIYTHNPLDTLSLPHNLTVYLYEDKAKNLWIGTADNGISKYNRQKDNFINYHRGISTFVRAMCQDEKGNYWAVGTGFFGILDIQTGRFKNLISNFFTEKPGNNLS
ncbi:MAG: hypothetical protein MUE81_04845, partial [Thermoflexibacter sp.]|nr:hypothetical protein [Thermoflexibacter sp.]